MRVCHPGAAYRLFPATPDRGGPYPPYPGAPDSQPTLGKNLKPEHIEALKKKAEQKVVLYMRWAKVFKESLAVPKTTPYDTLKYSFPFRQRLCGVVAMFRFCYPSESLVQGPSVKPTTFSTDFRGVSGNGP
jgi:hypothetical protein